MASHRAERAPRRTLRSTGRRAAPPTSRRGSVIGVVVALLAGLLLGGSQGSYAFWSDSDEVRGGTFTTGTLDLTVDGQQGDPTPYAKTDLAIDRMVPGESVAVLLTVRNAGDVAFTWTPTLGPRGGAMADFVTVSMRRGAVAVAGQRATYPRNEICSGGTPIAAGATAPALAEGAQTLLCLQVTMPVSTPDEAQGAQGLILPLTLSATQVLAP